MVVTGKKLKKMCEAKGWRVIRIEGSHHIMEHPEYKHLISIPIHGNKDLKKGTAIQIIKDAGLK